MSELQQLKARRAALNEASRAAYKHAHPGAWFLHREHQAIWRFLIKVRLDERGCWRWRSTIQRDGYAMLQLPTGKGTMKWQAKMAHRFSYEYFIGPIPEGAQIGHICGVRSCVNPLHLTLGSDWRRLRNSMGRFTLDE